MAGDGGERLPQQPQITTITGGFSLAGATEEERSCDERIHSERLATTFDTEHYEIVIQPSGLARALPSVVWHLEDLRVSSSYHNYYVARLASRFVKVVLAGAGGDELFGGYPWRYAVLDGASEAEFEDRYFPILEPPAVAGGAQRLLHRAVPAQRRRFRPSRSIPGHHPRLRRAGAG